MNRATLIQDPRPASAVPWRTGLSGLAGFLIGLAVALLLRSHPSLALVALVVCTGAPMWWVEWKRHLSSDPGGAMLTTPSASRRVWRAYGVVVAGAIWAVTLNVLPLASGSLLHGFWQALKVLWPLAALGVALYVCVPPRTHPAGLELAGRWLKFQPAGEAFPWHVLRDQLVKAFFLPLMLAFAYEWAAQADPWEALKAPPWYFSTMALLYLIDTVFGTVGYLSTSQRLDAHIRSSNPYWLGWVAALACYPPFFTWLQQAGFQYRDGLLWLHWLSPEHPLFYLWGGTILLLSAIYVLSTVVFGIRFSNLTHRGIITHGPYRWTKHPAYLSKNLSWWLISVPFISSAGTSTAALHCVILLGVNGIYWLRAKTEERHLMSDPVYRAYAAWIAKFGIFARLRGALPF